MSYPTKLVAALLVGLVSIQADAAVDPAVRCESGQLKATASYAACRLKADATALLKNIGPDYSKCTAKINDKFASLESKATCPSEGEVNDIITLTDDYEADAAFILSGDTTTTTTTTTTTVAPTGECGDGVIDAGEECDVNNLGGGTCAGEGFFNGTLTCGPGCTYNTSQCNATRFESTGSTVIDNETGLEWEVKEASNGAADLTDAHDPDNQYTWAASGNLMTGTLFTDFLVKLNGTVNDTTKVTSGCYANHCDWRVPTIDELKSIAVATIGCGATSCLADPILAPHMPGHYWSNSTRVSNPAGAYLVNYNTGAAASDLKTFAKYARAVRSID